MRKTIAAYTPPTPIYPPYFNVTTEENGDVTVTVRAAAQERDGIYVCGFARDRGQWGRCTPGDEHCNNYCNMAPAKGPMAKSAKPCKQVLCGETASFRMSHDEWEALNAEILSAK
jgi:hypothetical protein